MSGRHIAWLTSKKDSDGFLSRIPPQNPVWLHSVIYLVSVSRLDSPKKSQEAMSEKTKWSAILTRSGHFRLDFRGLSKTPLLKFFHPHNQIWSINMRRTEDAKLWKYVFSSFFLVIECGWKHDNGETCRNCNNSNFNWILPLKWTSKHNSVKINKNAAEWQA